MIPYKDSRAIEARKNMLQERGRGQEQGERVRRQLVWTHSLNYRHGSKGEQGVTDRGG